MTTEIAPTTALCVHSPTAPTLTLPRSTGTGESTGRGDAAAVVPSPRVPITIRPATPADIPFIDGLQKKHSEQVGWMPRKSLVEKIEAGNVLVAECLDVGRDLSRRSADDGMHGGDAAEGRRDKSRPTSCGYIIATDRYMGRDDVGIIYHLNIAPGQQRKLIGAALVAAVFERAAYGCRLFSCWCAQNIEANYFWESVGFLPLAFRSGGRARARAQIFWQRRVKARDATTPYWFPCQTRGGAMREDRLAIPIPPGMHWQDTKPILLPGIQGESGPAIEGDVIPSSSLPVPQRELAPAPAVGLQGRAQPTRPKTMLSVPAGMSAIMTGSGIKYVKALPPARTHPALPRARGAQDQSSSTPIPAPVSVTAAMAVQTAPARTPPKPRPKHDPKQISAARELRDRYMEQVNGRGLMGEGLGKYEVGA